MTMGPSDDVVAAFRKEKDSMDAVKGNGRSILLAKARQARRDKASNSIVTIDESAQDRLSRLDPARRASVEDRLSQMPNLCRNTYLKAVGGKSPASGVKAFCMECVGWDRVEVRRCTASACPLWAYRPFQERASS